MRLGRLGVFATVCFAWVSPASSPAFAQSATTDQTQTGSMSEILARQAAIAAAMHAQQSRGPASSLVVSTGSGGAPLSAPSTAMPSAPGSSQSVQAGPSDAGGDPNPGGAMSAGPGQMAPPGSPPAANTTNAPVGPGTTSVTYDMTTSAFVPADPALVQQVQQQLAPQDQAMANAMMQQMSAAAAASGATMPSDPAAAAKMIQQQTAALQQTLNNAHSQ